jgi:hypothetical protein
VRGSGKPRMADGEALVAGIALRSALARVGEVGVAAIQEALTAACREAVLREVADRTFERLPAEIGPVQQETELLLMRGSLADEPSIAALRRELVRAIRDQAPAPAAGVAEWWPNEVYVQRYEAGSLGVTPHVDSRRFVLLVAVFTLLGSSEFWVCEGRSGPMREKWTTRPGTLVLLRGPGLGGLEDGRPFHTVRAPAAGERYSLTFRMNASAG